MTSEHSHTALLNSLLSPSPPTPLGASTTREPPVCLVFSSDPTPPPHSVRRGLNFFFFFFFSSENHEQGATVRKATDPSKKLSLTLVKHVYVPVLTLHSLDSGMNSEQGFWRHAGFCQSHDFGFLSQPCRERERERETPV